MSVQEGELEAGFYDNLKRLKELDVNEYRSFIQQI